MPIILRLDRVMADRKMSLNQLAREVGISNVNLSNIKTGKISAIRFSTLDAICRVLDWNTARSLEFKKSACLPADAFFISFRTAFSANPAHPSRRPPRSLP